MSVARLGRKVGTAARKKLMKANKTLIKKFPKSSKSVRASYSTGKLSVIRKSAGKASKLKRKAKKAVRGIFSKNTWSYKRGAAAKTRKRKRFAAIQKKMKNNKFAKKFPNIRRG